MKLNQTLRRGLGVLLALVMCLSLLPATALAEGTPTETADFTNDAVAALALLNAAKTEGAADSEWDSTNQTLTLNGVNFTTSAATAVKLPDNAKIVLTAGTTNTITSTSEGGSSCGIYATNGLTIEGGGTLTVTGGKVTDNYSSSYGVYIYAGDVTIQGGTVIATGGEVTGTYGSSRGIFAAGSIKISGGSVEATGGEVTGTLGNSKGIFAVGSIEISGGSVEATGGTADGSSGLDTDTGVTISGDKTEVTAKGDTASLTSKGIYAAGSIEISGGRVTATGGAATGSGGQSSGIYAIGSIEISGGTVEATSGTAAYSHGFYISGSVTISGDTTDITARSVTDGTDVTALDSYGIYAVAGMTVSGGAVEATGGETENSSNGIKAGPYLTISGGTVTATGGQGAPFSCGIITDNYSAVTISGGTVTATGGQEASSSYGIYGYGVAATISGGHVIAQTLAEGSETRMALTKAPDLSGYTGYWWRTGPKNFYTDEAYVYSADHTYVEFFDAATAPTCTVTFDANGGSGSMAPVTGVSGSYTLPVCEFTAPEGKWFKGWAASATGEVITGAAILMTGDTTLYAIWKDPEHSMPGYHAIRTEGFEGAALPAGWSVEDKDGDGYNWEIGNDEGYKYHHGSGTATSASYVEGVGGLTPNNWLYMPEITIGTGYKLTFCLIAQNENWPGDKLGVYISTDGGESYTQIGEDYEAKTTWTEHTVDLSAYAGKEAIIAFVHHNSEDIYQLNLDCVCIWAPDDATTTYTVTVENDGNGSAAATPATAVVGTEITLSATANSGYHFKEWQVISGSVTITGNKFTMPASDVTVKAIFEADAPSTTTCTVRFDANGGSGAMAAVTVTSGENYILPACGFTAPEGKWFKGWATDAYGEVITDAAITVTGDVTLYAIWEDAEHSMPGYHVILTESFEDEAWPTGWSVEDKDGDGYNWGIEYEGSSYFCHHGSRKAISASYVNEVGALTPDNWLYMPEITIGTGYKLTFCLIAQDEDWPGDKLGVYISTDGGESYTQIGEDYEAGEDWTEHTVDLSAYAGKEAIIAFVHHNCTDKFWLNLDCVFIWAPDDTTTTYTVTVENDGNGSATATPTTAAAGTEITLSATANSGYHFKEWQVISGGVTITDNKFTMPASDVTVKAIFEADAPTTCTVRFDANGGSGTMAAVTVASGENYTLPECGFTAPEGKRFKGWATSATGEVITDAAIPVTGDVTLYAIWEDVSAVTTYTVTVNGSYAVTTGAGEYEAGDIVTLAAGSRSGYTFSGWTSDDITVPNADKANTGFVMPAKNVTVTANWTKDWQIVEPVKPVKPAEPVKPSTPFTDVPWGAYYEDAIIWAVNEGITSGTTGTTFSPDEACTRAQAVTFLWRAAGSPAPKSATMPFTDVAEGSYYYDAVLWALEQGITKGTSDTTFSPDDTCTRAQIVTFLWRAQNSPAAGSVNPFRDVASDDYYADAVLWAVENGITTGTSATTFSPDSDCTRAQIVTFLYRCLGK